MPCCPAAPAATGSSPRPARPACGAAYLLVLGAAVACYAALGAALGVLPGYVPRARWRGGRRGAPALTGAVGRPLAGRVADRMGPAPVMVAGAAVMAAGVLPALVQPGGAGGQPAGRGRR